MANLSAVLFRLTPAFILTLAQQKDMIFCIMIWVAPAVMISGQIGPDVIKNCQREVEFSVGILLIFAGILICLRSFSGSNPDTGNYADLPHHGSVALTRQKGNDIVVTHQ
jgi:uncharacterized membrane protein YfcA